MKKNKYKKSILFIFSSFLFINCISNSKYETFQPESNNNENSKHNLTLDFKNFDEFPLLIDIQIKNIKYSDSNTIVCGELSKEYQFKFGKNPINLNLDNGKYCVRVFVHYNTFRPYQKNFKAGLVLNLNSDKSCLEQPRQAYDYINNFNCPFLDLSNSAKRIIFSNNSSDRNDEAIAIVTWGLTFSSITRPPPILYIAPIPMFFSGYITKLNKIEFEIR
ncbi:MAG: hypothetical protein IBJ01_17595 [Leptospira sp.]|uniref:hypothetical protein n=1 Tax=Leptospira sp. TaxID=178 RepID=UPI0025BE3B48|nr:hypothetical protein [Leptospira sp.]MBL0956575.1 hypothetical protein [Leptospira sp.]